MHAKSITDLSEYLIPNSQEENYCEKHFCILRRLSNGAIILAGSRDTYDSIETSINFSFASGSWFDPPHKKGAHHLLEHLINPQLFHIATNNGCNVNATTSPLHLVEYVSGPLNISVKDFGVMGVVNKVLPVLFNPLVGINNPLEVISTERKIIENEIIEEQADEGWYITKTLVEWLYSPENPNSSTTTGTRESLSKITLNDIKNLVNQALNPDGLIISVFNEGKHETSKKFVDYLATCVNEHPRKSKRKTVDHNLLGKVSPNFENKTIFKEKTSLKNRLVTVLFGWKIPITMYSEDYFAFSILYNSLSNSIFLNSRLHGVCYSVDTYFVAPIDKTIFMIIELTLSQDQLRSYGYNTNTLIRKLYQLLDIPSQELKRILNTNIKSHEVCPVNRMTYFQWMLSGLDNYNQLIDTDKIIEKYSSVSLKHLTLWYQWLMAINPSVAVVGDI